MGFTRNGRFFWVQMRICFFDCKWLFKWYDSPGFRHPPSLRQPPKEWLQSKMEQIGSHDRVPKSAYTSIFATKFGCTDKILVFFQHHVEISFGGIPNSRNVYFYNSFWSVLRSQVLETPQLGFRELNGRKSCWTWPGSAPNWSLPDLLRNISGTFSGTLLNLT